MKNKSGEISKLDKETQAFIEWNFEQIKDDKALLKVIEEFTDQAKIWLVDHLPKLREILLAKMIKGAKEHGTPLHPLEKIDQELEGEYLDLIGWSQIKKYNQIRLKKELNEPPQA